MIELWGTWDSTEEMRQKLLVDTLKQWEHEMHGENNR